MSDIAKNIKRLRQRKDMTQEELAEKLFVTRQAVSNWETGKNQLDIDTLKSLAEVLEVDIKDVIYGPAPDEKRRRKVIAAVILCILAAVTWAIYFPFMKWAQMRQVVRFEIEWVFIGALGLKPLAFLTSGMAIPAIFSIWASVPPVKMNVRRCMLLLGLAVCLFHVWMVLDIYMIIPLGYPWGRFVYQFWWKNQWVFLVPGILLFWGWPRKAG